MASEWIWVLLVAVLLFGAKKLPELARSAGESLREFKKATREAMAEDDDVEDGQRRMEVADTASSETVNTSNNG